MHFRDKENDVIVIVYVIIINVVAGLSKVTLL